MPSDFAPSTEDRLQHEEERLPLARALEAIKKQTGQSWPELAAEIGAAFSHQTVSAWAAGKYQGRVDAVNAEVRKYLEARRARLAMGILAEPGFVPTPSATLMQGLFRQAQYLPTMVSLVGNPGVGKTKAAEDYSTTNPNVWMITALSGHPSGRWLLEELGRAMGLTERGGSQRLAGHIIQKLRAHKNPLLIVDEANHLAMATIDLLRGLHDQGHCGVALVGNDRVIGRLDNARDADFAQLSRRIGGRTNLKTAKRADIDAVLSAWGVEDERMVKLLRAVASKPGAIGRMVMTLRMARMLAAPTDAALAPEHIEMAQSQLSGDEAGA